MKYNREFHHRSTIRLKGYNYSQPGFYFITICSKDREHLFGYVKDKEMVLNEAGRLLEKIWNEIPIYYSGFNIVEFQVMPNHIHGILEIRKPPPPVDKSDAGTKNPPPPQLTLPNIVQRYKTLTTTRYIQGVIQKKWHPFNKKLWQRNYHEHIIDDQEEYKQILNYIQTNPENWLEDEYNTPPLPEPHTL